MSSSNQLRNDGETLWALIRRWRSALGRESLDSGPDVAFPAIADIELRPPADEEKIRLWESVHGFRLPVGLKTWLTLSDGLVVNGLRWIHPLRCIGPAVSFGVGSRLLQQPASWYEFGNPNDVPVNMDLIVTPANEDGRTPIFVSANTSEPDSGRIVAYHFADWFDQVIRSGFELWWNRSEASFLGDPIVVHFANMEPPKLPEKLCKLCKPVGERLFEGHDERELMRAHSLNRDELEQIITAFQYRRQKLTSR